MPVGREMYKDKERDAGSRGLTDRKICLAVSLGIFLGLIVSLVKLRSNDENSPFFILGGGLSPVARARRAYTQLDKRLLALNKANTELEKSLERLSRSEERKDLATSAGEDPDPFGSTAAGPAGTVKAPWTNPALDPDRTANTQLADILEDLHVNQEVLLAMGSSKESALLTLWVQQVKAVGISNALVVALDDEAASKVKDMGFPVYRWDPRYESETEGGGFRVEILRDVLALGYSALCSDLDVVILKDPFQEGILQRDSDVEGMSDGHDNATAYGYNDVTDDPSMGWARYAHTMRQFVINTGFMFVRPTIPALQAVDSVIVALRQEPGLDLVLFNFALWKPSSPGYETIYVSRRVLDFYTFANSKVFFRDVRKDWRFKEFVPVAVHLNFHVDKVERMKAIIDYYVNNQKHALNPFPDNNK